MIDKQYIESHDLKECLQAFHGAGNGKFEDKMKRLNTEFEHLAKKILYGGFILVGDDYEIYIRTVEFYYHEEKVEGERIEDPIVYHRNDKFPGRDVPPFPLMTLHSHWSGFDITFEDSAQKYRASALIREFTVFDRHMKEDGQWVFWSTAGGQAKSKYQPCDKPKYDDRSTYLQFYLNGFSIDGSKNRIIWKDFKKANYGNVTPNTRRNVFLDEAKTKKDDRYWSFRRHERLDDLREVSE